MIRSAPFYCNNTLRKLNVRSFKDFPNETFKDLGSFSRTYHASKWNQKILGLSRTCGNTGKNKHTVMNWPSFNAGTCASDLPVSCTPHETYMYTRHVTLLQSGYRQQDLQQIWPSLYSWSSLWDISLTWWASCYAKRLSIVNIVPISQTPWSFNLTHNLSVWKW